MSTKSSQSHLIRPKCMQNFCHEHGQHWLSMESVHELAKNSVETTN